VDDYKHVDEYFYGRIHASQKVKGVKKLHIYLLYHVKLIPSYKLFVPIYHKIKSQSFYIQYL
jgi:hypothetical protein